MYGTTNDARVPGTAGRARVRALDRRAGVQVRAVHLVPLDDAQLDRHHGDAAGRLGAVQERDTALTDATDGDGDGAGHGTVAWDYADANERSFVDAMLAWTAPAQGAGLRRRVHRRRRPRDPRALLADQVDVHLRSGRRRAIRSSDAWFNLLMRIKAQGLKVAAMNIGAPSAVDPFVRQDPNNPKRVKSDVAALEWVLHENAGKPLENYPGKGARPGVGRDPVRDARRRGSGTTRCNGRGKVVEMAKARLPLDDPERYRQEEYTWSLAKLSGGPVVLNAGFDFCGVPAGHDGLQPHRALRSADRHQARNPARRGRVPGRVQRRELHVGAPLRARARRRVGVREPEAGRDDPDSALASCRRITAFQGGNAGQGRVRHVASRSSTGITALVARLPLHAVAGSSAQRSSPPPSNVVITAPSWKTVMSPSSEILSTMSAVCDRLFAAAVRAPSCWLSELVDDRAVGEQVRVAVHDGGAVEAGEPGQRLLVERLRVDEVVQPGLGPDGGGVELVAEVEAVLGRDDVVE